MMIKSINPVRWRGHRVLCRVAFVGAMAVISLGLAHELLASDNPGAAKSAPPAAKKKIQKELSGAELYALHCNRCHAERYAPERMDTQWKTILLHMRTRANLPAKQARAILKYLEEDSGK